MKMAVLFSLLLCTISVQLVVSVPQDASSTDVSIQNRLTELLHNPPTQGRGLEVLDFPIVRAFFKNKTLVQQLVECFDITKECPYPGMISLIDEISDRFIPGRGCTDCPKSFNRIITYSQNQFQKKYRTEWNKLIKLLPDVVG